MLNKLLLQLFILVTIIIIHDVKCGGEEETTTTTLPTTTSVAIKGTISAYTVMMGLSIYVIHSFIVFKMM
ncbi:unnamed protein product [Schistosoma rodhaini]|uniref:MEG-29 protein n=1 Tax=Schistosoma mansoni TaxID=6183 RepID=A0A0U5KLL2_SCHMA|nr:unnamed protein product [Schistosoma rodhaini]CUS27855.1 TPA: MEG-29 protein [Schistosoma mansoni]